MQTIHDVRRQNLRHLISDKFAGHRQDFISQTGIVDNLVSRLLRDKTMGPSLARRIEQACGMPRGWMDTDHTLTPAIAPENGIPELKPYWTALPPEVQQYFIAKIKKVADSFR